MKVISKKIGLTALMGATLLLPSCRQDNLEDPNEGLTDSAMPRVTLNILPISVQSADVNVTEKIRELRIIMISDSPDSEGNTQSYVEYNEYFNFYGDPETGGMFNGPGEAASTFRFIITRNSVPGLKKFYLIANESMVNNVSFQIQATPPGIEEGMSLHDFLDNYGADYMEDLYYPGEVPEAAAPKGAEFETMINCLYFTPDFSQVNQGTETNPVNVIFLPYTSTYNYTLATQADIDSGVQANAVNKLNTTMYLVPAATKFRFKFENFRENPVVISSFKLAGIAPQMFLFAQVYSKDLNKDFGAKKGLWWVDWLALVSEESHKYGDPEGNLNFSNTYGWMNLFTIPENVYDDTDTDTMDNAERQGVIELIADSEDYITVPENTSGNPVQGPPGEYYTDFYYVPESRYMVDFPVYDDDGNPKGTESLQAYYLKLKMASGPNGSLTAVKDTQIGNLGSMFRNTNTYITIKLRDALQVGAYAQIEPWIESTTNGSVQQDDEPDE